MPKWEYLFAHCDRDRPRYVNGGELPNWEKTDLPAWANQRGEEGWELVGIPDWAMAEPRLVFKRPKA